MNTTAKMSCTISSPIAIRPWMAPISPRAQTHLYRKHGAGKLSAKPINSALEIVIPANRPRPSNASAPVTSATLQPSPPYARLR